MTTTDKSTASQLTPEDLQALQLAAARLEAVQAQIDAALYKAGLGQRRDAAVAALNEVGARIGHEYGAVDAQVDPETGVIKRATKAPANGFHQTVYGASDPDRILDGTAEMLTAK